MNTAAFVSDLERLGIQLWADGDQLRFRAPKGTMTPERLALLRARKQELLGYLDGAARAVEADPANRYEPFPLTDLQSAYLLGRHDTFAYGGVACHGYLEVAFAALDPARLEAAWQSLVDRHDMLRATIDPDGHQRVLPDRPRYRIAVADLRGAGTAEGRAAVEATRTAMSHRVYDPQQWPLFELRVTRTAERDLLHVSIDLLIADYLSIQLLLAELDQRYTRSDVRLPDIDVQFRDYLLAERGARRSAGYEADRAWWEGRLDSLPPAPALPVNVPARTTARFERRQYTMDDEHWTALRERAVERNVTPTGVLLAAYAEVISRWSSGARFTLNLTLLNRPPQFADLVGDFTSVTLLAVERLPGSCFAARAARLQERLWQDLDHRRYSGVEVMREIARRHGAGAALMPVVFTSTLGLADNRAEAGDFTGGGEVVHGVSQTPQVWIDCQVMEHRGRLQLTWDVRQGVFPDGLVDVMFAAYVDLVRRLVSGPEAWDARYPIPLPATQVRLRAEVNDTRSDLPETLLHEPVWARAMRAPDQVAVIAADRTLTYRQLVGLADSVAAWLRDKGCRPAEPVAVMMDKGWEQVVAVLGILAAGGAYVPVDTNQPPARRAAMLAGVRLMLTQSWLAGVDGLAVLAVDTVHPDPAPPRLPARVVSPGDLAYVIYTSGSTGMPKGVMVSHQAAANTVLDINARFAVNADDRVLGVANLGFDLSVYDIFGPLSAGGALVLPAAGRRGDPSHWADLLTRHRVTLWNSVPAQMQMLDDFLAGSPEVQVADLRLALLSGDWIPVTLPDAIRRRVPGLRVVSLGGTTEAAIWSVHYPIGTVDQAWRSIPYGFPLGNQHLHVLDADLQPSPDEVPGELYIGGVGLALGYFGDEERTAQRFITHPDTGERLYHTGDLGRYLPDGGIEFLGRTDTQVKIRGHRIELAEVEAALSTHPGVGVAAVVVDGATPQERRLVGFVEPRRRPDPPPSAATLARVSGRASAAATEVAADVDGEAFVGAIEALDQAALHAMLQAFIHSGLFGSAEDRHGLAEVLASARVAPRHHRLVRRWLRALTDNGVLTRAGDGWRLTGEPGTDPGWAGIATLAATRDYGTELVGYLRRSAEHLPELLRDELDPLALLFPEGRLDVAEAAYRNNVVNRYLNRSLAAALRAIAEGHPAGRPLTVLEVGAGVGGTTADLIDALRGHQVDYLFTDVSPFFLNEARQRFTDVAWLRYGLFDLNQNYRAQGYLPNTFDVIVCANVLHNAPHAGEMLGRLTELIRPGGWLLFIEATRDSYPLMASMEFEEGLTDFTDERRETELTFHRRDTWLALLDGLGAQVACCLPADDHPLAAAGQHTFAVRVKPDRAALDPVDVHRHLAGLLPEYMLPSQLQIVDALPLTGNGKVDRRALGGWLSQPTAGTATSAVAEPQGDLEIRLAGLWSDLLGVDRVGRDVDFYSLGGDSLLVSQLVRRIRDGFPEAAGRSWEVLLRQMLRTPTVAGFAAWLDQPVSPQPAGPASAQRRSSLVTLSAGDDSRMPVRVLVHDGSGTLTPYAGLVSALNGPVVGLAVADTAEYLRHDPRVLIARLAADYARELAAAGHRRLHLVGYCLGGLLATEVARQLTEAGAEVCGLTVISSYRVPYLVEDDLVAEYAFARLLGADPSALGYPAHEPLLARALGVVLARSPHRLPAGAFGEIDGDPQLRSVAEAFRRLAARPPAERLARLAEMVDDRFIDGTASVEVAARVFRQGLDAVTQHQPEPYAGDITFLRQSGEIHFLPGLRADMTSYWREVCLGDLRVHDIPGDHFTCLRPPHAKVTADVLNTGVLE